MKSELMLHHFASTPWAIDSRMGSVFSSIYGNHMVGNLLKLETKEDEDSNLIRFDQIGNKAIIPMHGVILNKKMGMEGMSGIITTLDLEQSINKALDDDSIEEIILDIDSPGGTVGGVSEISDMIYAARKEKKITAFVNSLMASAAYWIGSSADQIFASHTGYVGSIGVYTMHVDLSKNLEQQGVSVSFIKAGEFKTAGNPYEPLSEKDRAYLQSRTDYIYTLFTEAVARNRGVTHDDVLKTMAEGQIFIGEQALNVGLIDGISSRAEVIKDGLTETNKYSFLGGQRMLGTQLKKATLEQLKEENPELYTEARKDLEAKVEEMTQEANAKAIADAKAVAELERKETVMGFAGKFGLEEKAEELLAGDMTTDCIILALSKEVKNDKSSLVAAFEGSAPSIAGTSPEGEPEGQIKSKEQAFEFVKTRDGGSKAETWVTVRKEFANLFVNPFNIKEEGVN